MRRGFSLLKQDKSRTNGGTQMQDKSRTNGGTQMSVSRIVTVSAAVAARAVVTAVLSPTRGERIALAAEGARTKPLVEFTSNGELIQPTGYRRWVYLGTPLTPNDLNDGMATFPEFHNVYMDPESFDYFEKT